MHEAQLRAMLEQEETIPGISVKRFLFKTFLWLPLTFFGWYLFASWFSFPAIFLSDKTLSLLLSGVIEEGSQQGYWINIITSLDITVQNGQVGQLIFPLNALKYSYGFPLILAMLLAIPYSAYRKLDDITYGFIIVILTQTWGICFEALSSLLLKTGPDITSQILQKLPYTDNAFFLNFIALGYQLGFLILPAIVPLSFWLLRHKAFLDHLSRK